MMSNVESVKQLYKKCKDMDIEETLELVLSAETEEEKEFFSMVSDFVLQKQQAVVISKERY